MKSVYELGLLLLGEHCQPCFLVLMDKQPEIMSNLATSLGQLNEKHPPVGGMRRSPHVSPPLKRVEQTRDRSPADDEALRDFVRRQRLAEIRQDSQDQT